MILPGSYDERLQFEWEEDAAAEADKKRKKADSLMKKRRRSRGKARAYDVQEARDGDHARPLRCGATASIET